MIRCFETENLDYMPSRSLFTLLDYTQNYSLHLYHLRKSMSFDNSLSKPASERTFFQLTNERVYIYIAVNCGKPR